MSMSKNRKIALCSYVVSANGAPSSQAWGNAPGFVKQGKPPALKARVTSDISSIRQRWLKRAFSGLLGRGPRLKLTLRLRR